MKWQKAIDKINAEKYCIPHGWDTKEHIAEELQCSPERVHDMLKSGVSAGAFEAQDFPVWDAKRRMTTRVRCYRQKDETNVDSSLEDRIKASLARNPNKTNYQIKNNIRGATIAMVESIRKKQ
jgi:hypothetical protein